MKRREAYILEIDSGYQEYRVASIACDLLEARLRADPSFLTAVLLSNRMAQNLRMNLEGTFLIKLFAAFEAGLRDAWENYWRRTTEPPVRDLIDSIAAKRQIPQHVSDQAHRVRLRRNDLVHQGGTGADPMALEQANHSLRLFFSRLPYDW